ncbi:MAG TPA: hypothetical protein ENN58_00060 [bacterium]|nr:hypothetical protein [bacterium]
MWRRAKTTPQKIAVLDGFLPITADDYVKAVIYFSGDDDEFVWKKAVEKLKDISLEEIRKHLDENLPEKSALALARYAGDKTESSLIIFLITLGKVRPEWLLTYVRIHDEDFWKILITHKDFISFSIPEKDEYLSFFSEFSSVLSDLYEEQVGYLSSEEIEKASAAQSLAEEKKDSPAETTESEEEDEEVFILGDDDIDFPDFLTTEEAFEGLSANEAIEKKKTIAQMIKDMTIGEKVKLATTGNMEVRKLLIKDPRRIIATAVLANGKITDKEIIGIASDNAVSLDIITHIANTKSLSKSYRVKVALVMNPKTPLRIAMSLLDVLRMNDLKKVAKSRDIPNALKMKALKKVR